MTEKTGLFIGRFRPSQNGHLYVIEDVIAPEVDIIKIGIGSSQFSESYANPLSYEEVVEMLKIGIKTDKKLEFFPIPDINCDVIWPYLVKSVVGDFDVIYSGNPRVLHDFSPFPEVEKKVIQSRYQNISGTQARDRIFNGEDCSDIIRPEVIQYLKSLNFQQRLIDYRTEGRLEDRLDPAVPTVDVVAKYNGELLVMVDRENKPCGCALPGGIVDLGELPEVAARREIKEETNLDLKSLKLVGVYADKLPNLPADKRRDPRGAYASVLFYAEAYGKLKPQKGEVKQIVTANLSNIPDLVFDHNQMIYDCKKEGLI